MPSIPGEAEASLNDPRLAVSDARSIHIITRGNVDGIISSAFCFAKYPNAKATYVPSATPAVEILRKDLSARRFILVDLGLTPKLIRTLNLKRHTGQQVTLVDHHQQSVAYASELGAHVEPAVREGASAASVLLDHLNLHDPALRRLAAIADVIEYCDSAHLSTAEEAWGHDRIEEEAKHLDFAWRLQIDDDRFRLNTARKLARGFWPSEVGEVRRRYFQMLNENRWLRAKDRVRSHLEIRDGVALLNFGKRKPSLLGFGTRALTAVAQEDGADVAILVNRRGDLASIALRRTGAFDLNLGLFVEEFTREHGIVGGGHPTSAGAKIHARHLPAFLAELRGFA
ncbi:MAG: DHHA1 domain-containing protein [Thermoplasmatota archaeon]